MSEPVPNKQATVGGWSLAVEGPRQQIESSMLEANRSDAVVSEVTRPQTTTSRNSLPQAQSTTTLTMPASTTTRPTKRRRRIGELVGLSVPPASRLVGGKSLQKVRVSTYLRRFAPISDIHGTAAALEKDTMGADWYEAFKSEFEKEYFAKVRGRLASASASGIRVPELHLRWQLNTFLIIECLEYITYLS